MLRATSTPAWRSRWHPLGRNLPGRPADGPVCAPRRCPDRRRCECGHHRRRSCPLQRRSAQSGADLALQQMTGGIDLPLPPPVGTGQCEQNRTALGCRGSRSCGAADTPRASTRVQFAELRRHPGSAQLVGRDLVSDRPLHGQGGAGLAPKGVRVPPRWPLLLAADQSLIRRSVWSQIEHSMPVALSTACDFHIDATSPAPWRWPTARACRPPPGPRRQEPSTGSPG